MESAERRDLNMFYRLVNGIRERQMSLTHEPASQTIHPIHPGRHQHHPYAHDTASLKRYRASQEAESCVAHIIHTRNTPLDKTSYMHSSNGNEQSSSLPSESGHQALQAATLALQMMNHGASSDPEKHQEQEDHFQQGGWSLSGFEEEVAPLKDPDDENLSDDDDEEEGIFDLDL